MSNHMTAARCGICNLPAHRYSTADPEHEPNAVACVNRLLRVVGKYRTALGGLVADHTFGPVALSILREAEPDREAV